MLVAPELFTLDKVLNGLVQTQPKPKGPNVLEAVKNLLLVGFS